MTTLDRILERNPGTVARGCVIALTVATAAVLPGCTWMRTVARLRDDECRDLADRALDAELSGRFDEAARLWTRAADVKPGEFEFQQAIARVSHSRGDTDAELAALRRATILNPNDAVTWAELGRVYHQRGDRRAARQAVEKALRLDPRSGDALALRAEIAEAAGRIDAAAADYHRLLEVEPAHVAGRLGLARLQTQSGDAALAAPVLRSLCDCPDTCRESKADAAWSLGLAYGCIGRWNESADALSAAVGYGRSLTADDRYRLGYAQFRANDAPAARATLFANGSHGPSRSLAAQLADGVDFVTSVVPVEFETTGVPVPSGW